jgi:hypothetical protein
VPGKLSDCCDAAADELYLVLTQTACKHSVFVVVAACSSSGGEPALEATDESPRRGGFPRPQRWLMGGSTG